jgi:hypothetical protein
MHLSIFWMAKDTNKPLKTFRECGRARHAADPSEYHGYACVAELLLRVILLSQLVAEQSGCGSLQRISRPDLRSTQTPIRCVLGFLSRVSSSRDMNLTIRLNLMPRMHHVMRPLPHASSWRRA